MSEIFYFGEKLEQFNVRVLNEREVRAGSGILFLFAIISFTNALLLKNFYFIKLFIVFFFIDFFIRVIINPKFSPTLILSRFIVSNQEPEYVGAPQKRFAWAIGLVLAFIMFFVIVVYNITGILNLLVCLLCLTLFFLETAFGICVGCKIYNFFNKEKAQLCPGGACKIKRKEEIQMISKIQVIIVAVFVALIAIAATSGLF